MWTTAGAGVLLQPWLLVAAGAATVAEAHLASVQDYLTLCYFCVLSSSAEPARQPSPVS